MKEQIEKIVNHLCNYCMEMCGECVAEEKPCESVIGEAEVLYKAGYRKQSEGGWIVQGLANPKCTVCNSYNRCGDKSKFCPNCGAHMKG